jgi:hypothetical protein
MSVYLNFGNQKGRGRFERNDDPVGTIRQAKHGH